MIYEKTKLPFSYDSLEPYMDTLTVEIHYEKHLQTYVNNLNRFLNGYEEFTKNKSIEDILKDVENIPKEVRTQVINNGGGVYNHNFFFNILGESKKREPQGKLLKGIKEAFGSYNNMCEAVSKAAIGQFGSGWSWLVVNDKLQLQVISTDNQDSPISIGLKPILAIDVWEHAYYLKYKNLRNEYVKNIWNLFNWDKIEEIYEGIIKY